MSDAPTADVFFNGVHGRSGAYLRAPSTIDELSALVAATTQPELHTQEDGLESFGMADLGTDVDDLAQVGWGILVAPSAAPHLGPRFAELLERRKTQAGKLYREIVYVPGETFQQLLQRHNVAVGTLKPKRLPYYLLLVGSPTEIGFDLQFLLDLDYAVGRLCFDDPSAYERYAASVLAAEDQPPARAREIAYFGPRHDKATTLSSELLLAPLVAVDDDEEPPAAREKFAQTERLGDDARRDALLELLKAGGRRPAILFSASHGLGFDEDDAEQRALQGAILTQDWAGPGTPMQRAHYLAGADVDGDDVDVSGLVAFVFACYGAGTPKNDAFPMVLGGPPLPIAPEPFVGALPQALLGHRRGGALAFIGHVERAWGCSIRPPKLSGAHIAPFRNGLRSLMQGKRVGQCTTWLHGRAATLATTLAGMLGPTRRTASDQEIVAAFLEKNDALAYILLGDPAARLRVPA